MRSLDTNILVRAVLRDDKRQTAIVMRLLGEPAFVLSTVLLETVWVLQSRTPLTAADIVAALFDLMTLPQVDFADETAVHWALERFAAGADFPDMLHLALSSTADRFATFDQRLARFAVDSPVPVETLR